MASRGQLDGHSAGMTTFTYVLKSTVSTTPEVRRTRIVGGGVVVLDQPVQTAALAIGGADKVGSQATTASRTAAASRPTRL